MLKRLFVLLLIVAATVSTSTSARASTLTGFLECEALGIQPDGSGALLCRAYMSGGTGIYTYSWNPTPIRSGENYARIPCAIGYAPATVTVTVTDSSGATFTTSDTHHCNGAD